MPLTVLRVSFFNNDTFAAVPIPAIYCSEFFASEIAAEKSGESNSTFYTRTYDADAEGASSKWICPNVNTSSIEAVANNNMHAIV